MKIVLNKKFGGFSLSEKFLEDFYRSIGYKLVLHGNCLFIDDPMDGETASSNSNKQRCSPALVELVESWMRAGRGDEINGNYTKTVVVEVDEKRPWFIHTVYGYEIILYADEPNDLPSIKERLLAGTLA